MESAWCGERRFRCPSVRLAGRQRPGAAAEEEEEEEEDWRRVGKNIPGGGLEAPARTTDEGPGLPTEGWG